jgi:hypothetical protein
MVVMKKNIVMLELLVWFFLKRLSLIELDSSIQD